MFIGVYLLTRESILYKSGGKKGLSISSPLNKNSFPVTFQLSELSWNLIPTIVALTLLVSLLQVLEIPYYLQKHHLCPRLVALHVFRIMYALFRNTNKAMDPL